MGVQRPKQKLPHRGDAGRGAQLRAYFTALASRLERVRVACGDWQRVLSDAVTVKHGTTGILLDPPYGAEEHSVAYATGTGDITRAAAAWAFANGADPRLRIVLCGYEGEHAAPEGWRVVAWKARGGYARSQGRGRENAKRERLWLSPHCIGEAQGTPLFAEGAA